MSEHSIAIPPPPRRRFPEVSVAAAGRPEMRCRMSALREACLVGGFALAIFWVAAELAVALGVR